MRFEDQPWYQEVLGYNYPGLTSIWIAMAVIGLIATVYSTYTLIIKRKILSHSRIFYHVVMTVSGLFCASFIIRGDAQILLELQTRLALAFFGGALSAGCLCKIYQDNRDGLIRASGLALAALIVGVQLNWLSVELPAYSILWIAIAICESIVAARFFCNCTNEGMRFRFPHSLFSIIFIVNWMYLNTWSSLSISISDLYLEKIASSLVLVIMFIIGSIFVLTYLYREAKKNEEPPQIQVNIVMFCIGASIISIGYGLDLVIDPMMYSCRWLCLLPNNFVWPE